MISQPEQEVHSSYEGEQKCSIIHSDFGSFFLMLSVSTLKQFNKSPQQIETDKQGLKKFIKNSRNGSMDRSRYLHHS